MNKRARRLANKERQRKYQLEYQAKDKVQELEPRQVIDQRSISSLSSNVVIEVAARPKGHSSKSVYRIDDYDYSNCIQVKVPKLKKLFWFDKHAERFLVQKYGFLEINIQKGQVKMVYRPDEAVRGNPNFPQNLSQLIWGIDLPTFACRKPNADKLDYTRNAYNEPSFEVVTDDMFEGSAFE